MADIKLEDSSADKKYFILTPQLVWALSKDPYDFTLWNVIKMIAGETGECMLSTEDLATLAMMSDGKVSTCRRRLIKEGLLKGKIYRESGYPQPVWHLRIPNLWKANIAWREQYDAISARLKYKIEQKESLHLVKPSPGEEPPTPGEEPPTPGETKKNHEKNQKEEPWDGGEKTPPAPPSHDSTFLPDAETQMDLLFPQNGRGIEGQLQALERAGWHIRGEDVRNALAHFLKASNLPIPNDKSTRSGWIKSIRQHVDNFGVPLLARAYPVAIECTKHLTIGRPGSLDNTLAAVVRDLRSTILAPERSAGVSFVKNGGQHANHNRSKRVQGRISEYSVADPAAFDDQRADDAGP